LKAGSVMIEWLHRVIAAVWAAGKAPVEWNMCDNCHQSNGTVGKTKGKLPLWAPSILGAYVQYCFIVILGPQLALHRGTGRLINTVLQGR